MDEAMWVPFIDVLVHSPFHQLSEKATREGNDEDLGGTNGAAELPFHQPRTLKEQRSRKRRREFPTKRDFCCLFPPLFLQPLGSPGATFLRERESQKREN